MIHSCRHCGSNLTLDFLDLGFSPPSNAYLTSDNLSEPELNYPLRVKVCEDCWLAQTEDFTDAETLFTNSYAYFSSTSTTCLDHAARFADAMIIGLELDHNSRVVEIGSNDGYFLRNFIRRNIPCLGIEPTASTAKVAQELGIEVIIGFFGTKIATTIEKADLVYVANVYAHVPDINDFTNALSISLKPDGLLVLEFPHLMRLVESVQFDTVYHEHYSYYSLLAVSRIMSSADLRIIDVEELDTHGGSLRIFACHKDSHQPVCSNVSLLLEEECRRGMDTASYYTAFQEKAELAKDAGSTISFGCQGIWTPGCSIRCSRKGEYFSQFCRDKA